MNPLDDAVREYQIVRLANAFDLSVEQVRTLSNLERNDHTVEVVSQEPLVIDITENEPYGSAWYSVLVSTDGTLHYRDGR